ncbi:MAG: hypothetical protein IKT46_06005 [Clostridia bacterium]|nr:hypothetical protein [Clostridia bacterium]
MLFYEESVLAQSEDAVLVIGCDIPDIEKNTIDTLVIPDLDDNTAQRVEELVGRYRVSTAYIPDSDELFSILEGYDIFVIKVKAHMSFGVGGASVSVTAGNSSPALITRISMGQDRILLCGSMDKARLEEYKTMDSRPFGYINLTEAQKNFVTDILDTYTPHSLIFTGTQPYVDGYKIVEGSILLKE